MTGVSGLSPRVATVLDIPLHRFLGLTLFDDADPRAGITVSVGDAAVNNDDVLHGGIVTAVIDVAAYLALLPDLADDENAVTQDLTVSLLRPVARGSDVCVRGSVLRRGRSVVFLRAEASLGGVLIAAGQVTKTLVTVRP